MSKTRRNYSVSGQEWQLLSSAVAEDYLTVCTSTGRTLSPKGPELFPDNLPGLEPSVLAFKLGIGVSNAQ